MISQYQFSLYLQTSKTFPVFQCSTIQQDLFLTNLKIWVASFLNRFTQSLLSLSYEGIKVNAIPFIAETMQILCSVILKIQNNCYKIYAILYYTNYLFQTFIPSAFAFAFTIFIFKSILRYKLIRNLKYFQKMAHLQAYNEQMGGFDLTLTQRNELLIEKKVIQPISHKKTGTTIVGVKFDGGVVLGADTRATGGSIVVEKNCEKIHYIAPNIYCCGAGTAADTQFVNLFMSSNLQLQRLNSGRQTRISSYVTSTSKLLYKYEGHLGAHLIVGGYDILGPHLVMISGAGNYSYLPFATMGSGSLQAMTIFESKYKDNMTRQQAVQLVKEAISAGIYHDLGSGSHVDYCVITKEKSEMFRNAVTNDKLHSISI